MAGPRKLSDHWRQLAAMLNHRGISLVFDVGANTGQYVGYLRTGGYAGRVVSFEPQSAAYGKLMRTAAADAHWIVAPRCALGAAPGRAEVNISAESDMSSILPFRSETTQFSPTSRIIGTESVDVVPLDAALGEYARPGDRMFLKIDTQGYENAVLDGATESLARLDGAQVELSLVPLYQGEAEWRAIVDRLAAAGLDLAMVIPGYFDRHLNLMLQFDGIFLRSEAKQGSS